ncbi:TetR/AcrR family transcriptional regulator [Nocardia arizonensis]|uniref:TetR/AcrR family transcriptional regulator n=1 Tax=Nocardia arizonensis TaxID=1141647 RepID=UPI0006D20BFC|nr:TetR/AcrR family transcriptional regulator [Nocardia arizonensis]
MPRIQAATVAEHRAAQRRAILDAARELLAEGGNEAPGLAAVAKRTGLARPSVYRYFRSREDLLEAVIADSFPRWSRAVVERMDGVEDPGARVLAYVDANLYLVAAGEHAVVRGLAAVVPGERLAEDSRILHDRLRVPLAAAIEAHGADDPEGMSDLIQSIVLAASRMIENGADEAHVRALAHQLLEPYLRESASPMP